MFYSNVIFNERCVWNKKGTKQKRIYDGLFVSANPLNNHFTMGVLPIFLPKVSHPILRLYGASILPIKTLNDIRAV